MTIISPLYLCIEGLNSTEGIGYEKENILAGYLNVWIFVHFLR